MPRFRHGVHRPPGVEDIVVLIAVAGGTGARVPATGADGPTHEGLYPHPRTGPPTPRR